jgi:hypothetical protein
MRSTPALQAADLLAWCVNRQRKTPILLDWQDRVLSIDRDEDVFDENRLSTVNIDRLQEVRSWGMPRRGKFR